MTWTTPLETRTSGVTTLAPRGGVSICREISGRTCRLTVDKDVSTVDRNSKVTSVNSRERSSVPQTSAVSNGTLDNVVSQNVGDVCGAEVGKSRADGLERSVGRREDGNITEVVDGVDEVSGSESTSQRSQASGQSGVGRLLGQSKDAVDDVDHTAGEVNVGG
jgi:hypothetical protein